MNLTFLAGGRRRKLFKRKQGGPWHVRFEINGRGILRSLDTTDEAAAKIKGKAIIEAELAGDQTKSRELKARSDYSTLRQIADLYVEKFGTDPRRRRTALNNVGALRKIVAAATGLPLERARASILDGELIRKFEASQEARIRKDANGYLVQQSELEIRTSTQSWVKQARSIFRQATLSWFEGLALPDLTGFKSQGVKAPDRPRPEPLDERVIAQVNAAAPELARTQPAVYIAHLLFKYLGMRNSEIKHARRSWIIRDPKGFPKLGVIYRPLEGFKPKAKTERWIPMSPVILAELEKYWAPSPDGDYLVPAPNKTERDDIVDDQHNAWCGKWIKDRTKVAYELRRHAGSLIYTKTGKIEHVQKFLGHAGIKTTMEWYWYLLDETPPLDPSDFAGPTEIEAVA